MKILFGNIVVIIFIFFSCSNSWGMGDKQLLQKAVDAGYEVLAALNAGYKREAKIALSKFEVALKRAFESYKEPFDPVLTGCALDILCVQIAAELISRSIDNNTTIQRKLIKQIEESLKRIDKNCLK